MAFTVNLKVGDEMKIGDKILIRIPDQSSMGRNKVKFVVDAPHDVEIGYPGRIPRADMRTDRFNPNRPSPTALHSHG